VVLLWEACRESAQLAANEVADDIAGSGLEAFAAARCIASKRRKSDTVREIYKYFTSY